MDIILINSGTLLICCIIIYDVNKDLNTLLSFPDQAIPLKLKNDLRIILDLKPEKTKNIETRKKFKYSYKKSVDTCSENKIFNCTRVSAKSGILGNVHLRNNFGQQLKVEVNIISLACDAAYTRFLLSKNALIGLVLKLSQLFHAPSIQVS